LKGQTHFAFSMVLMGIIAQGVGAANWPVLLCLFFGAFLGTWLVNAERRGLGYVLGYPWSKLIRARWADKGVRGPTHSIFTAPLFVITLLLWIVFLITILSPLLVPALGALFRGIFGALPLFGGAAYAWLSNAYAYWTAVPLFTKLAWLLLAALIACYAHLMLDYISAGGGFWLWPWKNRRMLSIPLVRPRSARDWQFMAIFGIIAFVVWLPILWVYIVELFAIIWRRVIQPVGG